MTLDRFEIFLATVPGLEEPLRAEALECGFKSPRIVAGGVRFEGRWEHVWRANLHLRGASRVLARVGRFEARHLSQLAAGTQATDWASLLHPGTPLRVDATCRKSRIYHDRAAAERISEAIARAADARPDPEAALRVLARIDRDVVTLSLDTSGDLLHRRGLKSAVGKAPLRETMAAMFLRQMGFDGHQAVVDPMCGSGTILLEAAGIATGQPAGAARNFAFQSLANFDAEIWAGLMAKSAVRRPLHAPVFGADRDAGAVAATRANLAQAGLADQVDVAHQALSGLMRPDCPAGIMLVNPPYGGRIGAGHKLFALYGTLGRVAREQFGGWRIGVVTTDEKLARATSLPLDPGAYMAHGGLKVRLWQGVIPE